VHTIEHREAESPFIRQVIGVHGRAVIALDGRAIDEQIPASMRADVAQGNWWEGLALTGRHGITFAF
jgi:hypothetical protein